jgi:hypothetical protein
MKKLLALAIVAGMLSGCMGLMRNMGLETGDCLAYDVVSSRYLARYEAKCEQAPDPTDNNCINADLIVTASALCRAAAASGDAEKNAQAVEKFEDAGVEPAEAVAPAAS